MVWFGTIDHFSLLFVAQNVNQNIIDAPGIGFVASFRASTKSHSRVQEGLRALACFIRVDSRSFLDIFNR
jgi:hypothetical protein